MVTTLDYTASDWTLVYDWLIDSIYVFFSFALAYSFKRFLETASLVAKWWYWKVSHYQGRINPHGEPTWQKVFMNGDGSVKRFAMAIYALVFLLPVIVMLSKITNLTI